MKHWQSYAHTYKLGVLLAEYVKSRCQLCHFHPSSQIINPIATDRAAFRHRSFLSELNSGILCHNCHHSISWLPKPTRIDLNLDLDLEQDLPIALDPRNYQTTYQNSYQTNQKNSHKTNQRTSHQDSNSISIQPATYYQYPMNQVIRRFKLSEEMKMLPILVHAIRQLSRPQGHHGANSVILPVPTTRDRLRKRGFNPLSILTPYLSAHWDIPIWQGVERVDNTLSQRKLSREERQENVKGAFVVQQRIPVDKVIIFDDVATTGATIKELASVLHSSSKMTVARKIEPRAIKTTAYCIAHGNAGFQRY